MIGRFNFSEERGTDPQTNGKIERFCYEYERHRWRFNTLEDYLDCS